MRFDELFAMRKLIGTKLKDYIRSNGFSKVSLCKKTEISRPTLDKILNGEIDNKSIFNKEGNSGGLESYRQSPEMVDGLDFGISCR